MSLPGHASGSGPTSSGRDFTRIRKGGLDPTEVQAHIDTLQAELTRLEESEAQLRAELAARPDDPLDELDPAVISRALGEETVRIIDAAREAADDIRAKAEENAARVVRDAHDRATRVTREAFEARDAAAAEAEELTSSARETAETLVRDATAESEALVTTAEAEAASIREDAALLLDEKTTEAQLEATRIRADAEQVLDAANADVERLRAEADAAAAATREQAELDAEALLDDAREQGREMIREAKEARERMIRNLAERRHASRRQLEALRAGRERLIEAFAAARTALDEATDELVESLPAARQEADAAARAVEEDLDAATAELDDLIARGVDTDALIDADAGPMAVRSDDAVAEGSPTRLDETEGLDEPVADVDDSVVSTVDDDQDDVVDVEVEVVQVEVDEIVEVEVEVDDDSTDADSAAGGSVEEVTGSHLRLVSSNDGAPRPVGVEALTAGVEDAAEATAAATVDAPASGSERTGQVEELFARLRADHAIDDDLDDDDDDDDDDLDDEFDDEDEDDDDDDDSPSGAVVIDLSSVDSDRGGAIAEVPDEAVEETAAAASPDATGHQELLDRRDDLIGETARGVSRRLRRVVTDQENELLDLIRRNRKMRTSDDLVASAADQVQAYRAAVADDLRELLVAGAMLLRSEAELLGDDAQVIDPDDDAIERALDELIGSVGEWVVDPLRTKVARIVDDSDDSSPDRSELVDRIRAAYREWRNERLAEVAGDLTTLGLNRGVLLAAAPGRRLRWVVDHGGLGCADGEDNQLAGPVVAGEEYPTGDACPPAHPGCRCLLVPAP